MTIKDPMALAGSDWMILAVASVVGEAGRSTSAASYAERQRIARAAPKRSGRAQRQAVIQAQRTRPVH